ncbi:hypothetical protein KC332_g12502 [Hortaea werneckii]|uniref:Exosome complex component RRP45 n=2 Tax=Hortaea werneckii TaxID=91943 RepID=A0A3M7I4C9_HORWE|nr:hypothetical protein KC358_g12449 [Hortaea werneckii]OTA23662.1 hypothetical protein BTJ68_13185 [Hortaea werneckii EXF-2000]KAI6812004.1 hypothetical protein KC350_g12041 [Hortaea werneckii]KAI6912780.1 hypothetical protein KC348_g12594 [Hortaea werneckii]KAI6927227.1 hypothetical protein KC341_g12267 [Hortaea werneckii]
MPAEALPSTNESAFLLSALRENIRLDHRPFDAYRPISLSFPQLPDQYGVADVRLGKTRVLCNISSEVVAPYADRKFEGLFTINCELSPMGSAAFEAGRTDQLPLPLSRLLEKTIRRSGALDTESLCIIAGQKCFHVRADLHVLDHDGNLLDACCVALVAALLHYRRPDVEVKGEDVTVFDPRERDPVKLNLHHTPFCVTFSYFDSGEIVLQDANLLEEQCKEGEVIVGINRFGEVCQIAKYGGAPVEGLEMLKCVSAALERVKMLDALVKEALRKDDEWRDRGGVMKELRAENER